MDATGHVTWQNRASLAFGTAQDAGSPTATEITQAIQDVLARSAVWKGGGQFRNAAGNLRYFDKSITAVRNSEGALVGYVSLTDDITDTIKGELRYKRLLETAQDGFAITDITGKYVEVNESFARMVGYSTAELKGMNAQELFIHNSVGDWLARTAKTGTTEHPRYKAVLRKKDGSELTVQSSVTFEAEEQQFYAFVHDTTAEELAHATQRELENQLLHAQKVHALGALTSGIAHDFNNILASILGYSNLALERFVPDKTSKLAKYLDEVVSASERARDLISKMLTFTRSKPNRSAADIQPAVAIAEVVAMLRPSIPSNIGIQVRPGSQTTVRVDSGELNQILVNLIINARDAISSHGEIVLGWERLDATGCTCAFSRQRLSGAYIAIYVSDTGSGIEADTLEHMFDPYFTTKDVGKGSGLGLPMVQGIMRRAGGHVLVASTPGAGTEFKLLFPVTRPGQTAAQQTVESAAPAKGDGRRIWVIDDEAPIARYMDELLSEWGYAVRTYQDPILAWEDFQRNPADVDLLVTDHTMHGMTGTELIAKMQGLVPGLPVIICSGTVDEASLGEGRAMRVFHKPVDTLEFLRTISKLLTEYPELANRQ
jgi:PAS domain S-box-containing protein